MEFKGKPLSLGAKLFSVLFVLVGFTLLALGIFDRGSITVWDILAVGLFIALVFSPVDASLVLQNWPTARSLPFPRFPGSDNRPLPKEGGNEPPEGEKPIGFRPGDGREAPPCGQ